MAESSVPGSDSLESLLKNIVLFLLLLQAGLCGLLLLALPWWQVALIGTVSLLITSAIFIGLYSKIFTIFQRIGTQLDALQHQDFSILAKPVFHAGIVAEFQQQFNALRESLQIHKSHYNQQLFVLYQMIDHLNTPILVFDHKQRLNYANSAFAQLFGRPWQTLRHAKPDLLGLIMKSEWQFSDALKQQEWQIRTSRFVDQGQENQLLIFINIKSALRNQEQEAWQKLIRVLSHEIRNSLTPVAALAQSLQQKVTQAREKEALSVIEERCQHLRDFVARYAQFQQPIHIEHQLVNVQSLIEKTQGLFPQQRLTPSGQDIVLQTDPVLLQQVLINLLKNAEEAGSPPETVELTTQLIREHSREYCEIKILDQGQGITNEDNLFVPFYTTKSQGQGIGLNLCRHIVEQLGGQLSLSNRSDRCGACAQVRLPIAESLRAPEASV